MTSSPAAADGLVGSGWRVLGRATRFVVLALVVLSPSVLAGCGTAAEPGSRSSAAADWWRPEPGEYANWDWQITEPYDLSAPRAMYDVDLFDLAPVRALPSRRVPVPRAQETARGHPEPA